MDAHVHVWDLTRCSYAWLGPQHGELYRSYLPEEAATALTGSGVAQGILVQAEDSVAETDYLLSVAAQWPVFAGVVGWLPLDDPDATSRQLELRSDQPALRGIRHLVHDDPREDFLELPAVRASLVGVAAHGLPYDIPDAWPRHLDRVADLADAIPELTVVVDHLGKPPGATHELAAWERALRRVADRPGTVAKLSGLQAPGRPYTADSVRRAVDVAFEAFGPGRLMYGGDWPITVPFGGYERGWAVTTELVAALSADERAQVLAGTARRVYGLPG